MRETSSEVRVYPGSLYRAFDSPLMSCTESQSGGYYAWRGRAPSQRAQMDQFLLDQIKITHERSREHYGIVKCWKALMSRGIECGRDQIARIRRHNGIYSKRRRRFIITTRSKQGHRFAPNVLMRNFTTTLPNQAWVGDVTFIPTRQGWLYLAVMIDLYSRKVVGWSMSNRNNAKLAEDSLKMAITHRRPNRGLIHHTDRGAPYATKTYKEIQENRGMIVSMSRKRDCWDNAGGGKFLQ